MNTPKIITIGSADKGGWWYEISDADVLAYDEGFPTAAQAAAEAQAACEALAAGTPWEVWYKCDAAGRSVLVPGEKSENHPE